MISNTQVINFSLKHSLHFSKKLLKTYNERNTRNDNLINQL